MFNFILFQDEEPVPKKAVTAKKVANGKGKADSGSSEESSDGKSILLMICYCNQLTLKALN